VKTNNYNSSLAHASVPCGKTNFAGILFIEQRENLTDSTEYD